MPSWPNTSRIQRAKESSAAVYRGQKSMAESNAETSRKGKSGEHVVRMGEWSGVGDSQQIKTSTPRKLFSTDFFFYEQNWKQKTE